ncbi:MAG TPA: protein kinase [Candidatus Acidoferrum sp.]
METIVKAGRYEILGELGRGAMGVVYRATDPVIGRPVAVKTIRLSEEGTGLTRPELLSRFQTEARAAGLLTHPNIVVVYDAGEENGLYYITMELVEGKSLQALIDGGHAFPASRALRIMEQTCSALQFAHERNIVHRDIKPANLMLTRDDTVKVTDFGTAKILQFGTVQQTTHVMGTPSYMSPEQVKGRPVDGRSDIFSLGVVLYELLTGEKPFPGHSITTVIYKIVNEEPIPPRQLNPAVHPGLNEIVMRALSKEPETRYQNCREMLEDLRSYRALGGGTSPDMTVHSARTKAAIPLISNNNATRGAHAHDEDSMTVATVHSLQQRVASPTQTPVIRRTGPIQTYEEPKKKNTFLTVLAAIFLLSVIAFGVNRLRPEFQAARVRNNLTPIETSKTAATPAPSASQPVTQDATEPASNAAVAQTTADADSNKTLPAKTVAAAEPTSVEPIPAPVTAPVAAPKKSEPALSATAAEYKGRIEEAIAEQGLASRVKVQGSGNTLALVGKLRPNEHATLLRFMRNAPAAVHVVDDTQYDDTALAGSEKGQDGSHPVPAKGKSAIHVITDVIGAVATLYGPAGREIANCTTPCSFDDLEARRYSLQVQKDGYQSVQSAFELKKGDSLDQKLHLESLAKGLLVTSHPAGADIFINGAKQSGQTPANLPLGPGQYDLVLRLAGYEAYSGHVQVKDNIQTSLNADLKERSQTHVAWAQVTTVPAGAEIFIDGASTGSFSPARVQMSSGTHVIVVRLNGYQQGRRGVQATEGGTVIVSETLKAR